MTVSTWGFFELVGSIWINLDRIWLAALLGCGIAQLAMA
jgi:hypothetical protein